MTIDLLLFLSSNDGCSTAQLWTTINFFTKKVNLWHTTNISTIQYKFQITKIIRIIIRIIQIIFETKTTTIIKIIKTIRKIIKIPTRTITRITQRAVDTNVVSVGPFSFEKSLISIIVDAQDKDIQPSFNKIINNAEKEGRLLSTSEQPRTYIFLNNGFIIASKNRTETLIKKMFENKE